MDVCDKKWRRKHRERWLEILRTNSAKRRKKLRDEIIQLLGGKCSNPYNIEHGAFLTDIRCLQIDHINGGGNADKKKIIKRIGDGEMYYKYILEKLKSGSKDYQSLCANCNWIKKYENKENKKY